MHIVQYNITSHHIGVNKEYKKYEKKIYKRSSNIFAHLVFVTIDSEHHVL
jgi:hypothetical protein